MKQRILIAGAGIGGLAGALALRQRGFEVTVLEAAVELSEVGAGIQLGPHAMHVLAALGLENEVRAVASFPESVVIADAASGKPISRMLLGEAVRKHYGQAYVTLHRGDLHALLLKAVQQADVPVKTNQSLLNYEHSAQQVQGNTADFSYETDVLIGADGLWSHVRSQMASSVAPRATGHAAFRALLPAREMPEVMRSPHVRTWWARDIHVVSYPIRGGNLWNVVILAELPQQAESTQMGWSLPVSHTQLMGLFKYIEPQLRDFLEACGEQPNGWKRWNLFDSEPLRAEQMAQGRVALLGDAAHPMLPYFAQGAAMALEDAWVLAQCLSAQSDAIAALKQYAQARASRNARVVRTARRNGQIFHLSGVMASARNAVLALQGTQVLGMPWLYGFKACA